MTRSALAAKMASRGRVISVAAASLGNAALANAPMQRGATLAMGSRIVDVHTLPGWPTRPARSNGITPYVWGVMGLKHNRCVKRWGWGRKAKNLAYRLV
eukprot:357412-Chlamydomonas_euryale.AAC.2